MITLIDAKGIRASPRRHPNPRFWVAQSSPLIIMPEHTKPWPT
ncbi:MAG TPA: hypothetical protein VGE82_00065 [Nitrososphaera sp.]